MTLQWKCIMGQAMCFPGTHILTPVWLPVLYLSETPALESVRWPKSDFRKDKTTDIEDACEEWVTQNVKIEKQHLIYEFIYAFKYISN